MIKRYDRSLKTKHSKLAGLLLCVGAVTVLLAGCGGSKPTSHMDAPAKTAAVYKAKCINCHGSELQGRIGAQTNLQKVGATLTEEDIIAKVKNGSGEGGTMPAFQDKLSDEEIAQLAAWLAGKK
ncbi:c-type cytochrome [Paenibacillus sp. NPDC058071]|uniref:c-type cytochrome n=1 Tax=Paenibacillus sp. NPDC058071 TaxID=3346326 RepID=UPI0036DE5235